MRGRFGRQVGFAVADHRFDGRVERANIYTVAAATVRTVQRDQVHVALRLSAAL